MEKIISSDKMFKQFCDLLEKYLVRDRYNCIFKDIEERFGLWLKINEEKGIEEKEIEF